MKKTIQDGYKQVCYILAILLLTGITSVKAAVIENTDSVMHAIGVLKGVYEDYSKEHAVCILMKAAEKSSTNAYAMNALGLVYMEGIGTERNADKAIYWLNEAGTHGCVDAYHNLGILYKLSKCGVRQDLTKSYEAFAKGAELGSIVCKYDAGFMLYKGLGCNQDYSKAFDLFKSAADAENKGALYMLGLCYRNGYGTEQDEEKGLEILKKAADLGYNAAIEELTRPNPENCLHDIFVSNNGYGDIPMSMPEVNAVINDTTLLRGNYEGFIVMYDWSGKFILGEKPVVLSLARKGKEAFGIIALGNDTIPFNADIQTNGSLKFKKSYANLNERYTYTGKVKYSLSCAKLDIWNDKIRGELSLYNIKEREPERPMFMELYRKDAFNTNQSDIAERYSHITVTPNPFAENFDALFELSQSSPAVVRVFDKFGKIVWQKDLGLMEEGKHRETFSPNLIPGYYVLNIAAGQQTLRTIIVKNGGE